MDRKKYIQEIIIMASLMIISGLFYFVFIPKEIRLSAAFSGRIAFSSRTFPYILSVALFIFSSISFVKTVTLFIKSNKESKEKKKQEKDKTYYLGTFIPIIVYGLIILYAFLFKKIGYIMSSIIILPILMYVLGNRKIQNYFIVYVFAGVAFIVFKMIFKIPIP